MVSCMGLTKKCDIQHKRLRVCGWEIQNQIGLTSGPFEELVPTLNRTSLRLPQKESQLQ
jgi:hypothetical protein